MDVFDVERPGEHASGITRLSEARSGVGAGIGAHVRLERPQPAVSVSSYDDVV